MELVHCLAVLCCVAGISYAGPLHASCKLDWSFALPCDVVQQRLVAQVNAWNNADNCPGGAGEKCLYALKSQHVDSLTLVHETPVHHYKDDISFTFVQGSAVDDCKVHGYSTSETWYAVLDYGTNYCNMRNLLEGAGLHTSSGFSQSVSDSHCTQYSSANCDKY